MVSSKIRRVRCLECPRGYRSQVQGSRHECLPCPKDTIQSSTGQGECIACPQGKNSPRKATRCEECPPGKYGKNTTIEGPPYVCNFCPKGTYRAQYLEGGARCLLCPSGWSVSLDGSPTCSKCLPGSAQARHGANICNDCPVDFYSNFPNGISSGAMRLARCKPCPSGFHRIVIVGRHLSNPWGRCPSGCGKCGPGTLDEQRYSVKCKASDNPSECIRSMQFLMKYKTSHNV